MSLEDRNKTNLGKEERSQQSLVTVYTEVTEQRAEEILLGTYDSELPPVQHKPMRWYAEAVLEQYQDDVSRELGLARRQSIFTSPIPYQGHSPVEGRVLLALEVDPESLYVAEGDNISAMWSGSLKHILALRQIFGDRTLTREEFEIAFKEMPRLQRDDLITHSSEHARAYWQSIVPFDEYIEREEHYYEPEILMTPSVQIASVRRVE